MKFLGKKLIFGGILSTFVILFIASFTLIESEANTRCSGCHGFNIIEDHHNNMFTEPEGPYNPYCPDPVPGGWICQPCHYSYNEECIPSLVLPGELFGNSCVACHAPSPTTHHNDFGLDFPENCISVALPGDCFKTPESMIDDLISFIISLNLQSGIENSLDSKLSAALNALDDINENNDIAAINSLNAFINAVEAQRGNKITNEDADALIAAAQAIIATL